MINVFIVSLSDSERRDKIASQLDDVKISNYHFFDAFDARQMSESELSFLFDKDKFYSLYNRYPSKGEIGCTLSHLRLIEYISNHGIDEAIILEDDAIITKKFIKFYQDSHVDVNGVVILGYSKVSWLRSFYHYFKRRLIANIKKYNSYSIGCINKQFTCGTVGYYINLKNIRGNIDRVLDIKPGHLADDWSFYADFMPVMHIRPFAVFENYKKMKSSIEEERCIKVMDSKK